MLYVEFYRLYNGTWARNFDFVVIFAIFTKVCHAFAICCRDFFTVLSN